MKKTLADYTFETEILKDEAHHDRLVGIAMSLIEGVFEVREGKAIDGEEYYNLEDEIIEVLKAKKVR